MKAYRIEAEVKHKVRGYACLCTTSDVFYIDASSIEYAKRKIARKYKTEPRHVKITDSRVIGYY